MAPKTPKARRARSSASASSSSASASYVSGHDNPSKSDDPVQPSSTADFLAQAADERMATLLIMMTSNTPDHITGSSDPTGPLLWDTVVSDVAPTSRRNRLGLCRLR